MSIIQPAPDFLLVKYLPPEEDRTVGGIIRIDPGSDMITCEIIKRGDDAPEAYLNADVVYIRKNSLNHITDDVFCVHHNSVVAFK